MPRPDCAPEGIPIVAIRGRSLASAVDSLPYDCIGCIAHFCPEDWCCGFTVPQDARPWFQRVGFTISPEEMQPCYERSQTFSVRLVLDSRSAMHAVADDERAGRSLDPKSVRRMLREAGLPAADYLAGLVAADNERREREPAGKGRPKDGGPDRFAGYADEWNLKLTPWLLPRWRHVWRAECMFQVRKRGLTSEAARRKVAAWYGVSEGVVRNSVGGILQKK